MNKVKQYHLRFEVTTISNQQKPVVISNRINGFSVNSELATFLNDIGPNYAQEVINEIIQIDFRQYINNQFIHSIPSCFDQEDVELFSSPNRASFNDTNGGYVDIPLQDFLEILQEWKSFLENLPFKYYYADK